MEDVVPDLFVEESEVELFRDVEEGQYIAEDERVCEVSSKWQMMIDLHDNISIINVDKIVIGIK